MYVLVMSRLQKRHNNCILKQIVNVWKYTIWKEIWICFFNWKIAVYYVYYICLFFHENASLFNKWPSIYIIRVMLCPFVRPFVRPSIRPSVNLTFHPSVRLKSLVRSIYSFYSKTNLAHTLPTKCVLVKSVQ